MAVMAGNQRYEAAIDLPPAVPIFPLSCALLLPSGQMPLNVFEPRYLAMVDEALKGDRLIGMIQPDIARRNDTAAGGLCRIGCVGRIVQFAETGDGRYLITLAGVSRFHMVEELSVATPFRQCRIDAGGFSDISDPRRGEDVVDRSAVLRAFQAYFEANGLEADWDSVNKASNAGLVTALSMMSPWGAGEKQALLEAPDHAERARALVAITEIALAGGGSRAPSALQ